MEESSEQKLCSPHLIPVQHLQSELLGQSSSFSQNISHLKRGQAPFGISAKVRKQSLVLRTCHVNIDRLRFIPEYLERQSNQSVFTIISAPSNDITISARIRGQKKYKTLRSNSIQVVDGVIELDFQFSIEYLHHLKGLSDILLIKLERKHKSFSSHHIELSTVLQCSFSGDIKFYDAKDRHVATVSLSVNSQFGKLAYLQPYIESIGVYGAEEEKKENPDSPGLKSMIKDVKNVIAHNFKKLSGKPSHQGNNIHVAIDDDDEIKWSRQNNPDVAPESVVLSETDSDSSTDSIEQDLPPLILGLSSAVLWVDIRHSQGKQLLDWIENSQSSLRQIVIPIASFSELSTSFTQMTSQCSSIGLAADDDMVSHLSGDFMSLVAKEPRAWESAKIHIFPLTNSSAPEKNAIASCISVQDSTYRSMFFSTEWLSAFDGSSKWKAPVGRQVENTIVRYLRDATAAFKLPVGTVVIDRISPSSESEITQEIHPFIRDFFVGSTSFKLEYWKKKNKDKKDKKSTLHSDFTSVHVKRNFVTGGDQEFNFNDLILNAQYRSKKELLLAKFTSRNASDYSGTLELSISQLICMIGDAGEPDSQPFTIELDGVKTEGVTFASILDHWAARINFFPITIFSKDVS